MAHNLHWRVLHVSRIAASIAARRVALSYDTLVVEGGVLHIYPDVYGRRLNLPKHLSAELESSGVDVSNLDEGTMKEMLSRATRRTQFVVETSSIEQGRALEDGQVLPLIPRRKK